MSAADPPERHARSRRKVERHARWGARKRTKHRGVELLGADLVGHGRYRREGRSPTAAPSDARVGDPHLMTNASALNSRNVAAAPCGRIARGDRPPSGWTTGNAVAVAVEWIRARQNLASAPRRAIRIRIGRASSVTGIGGRRRNRFRREVEVRAQGGRELFLYHLAADAARSSSVRRRRETPSREARRPRCLPLGRCSRAPDDRLLVQDAQLTALNSGPSPVPV